MSNEEVNQTQITHTLAKHVEATRFNGDRFDDSHAWGQFKMITDSNGNDHEVLDTECWAAGLGHIETENFTAGSDLYLRHQFVSRRNDLNVEAAISNLGAPINHGRMVSAKLKSQNGRQRFTINAKEETMRQLAESILEALDGKDA